MRPIRTRLPLIPLFIFSALSLNACFFAPQEVIRIRAERACSTWSNGLELHSANTMRLEVRSGFLEYSHARVHGYSGPHPLYFLISATNASDSAVLIDPLDFRIGVPGHPVPLPCMGKPVQGLDTRHPGTVHGA